MNKNKVLLSLCAAVTCMLILCACGGGAEDSDITLSADGVSVNGVAAEYDSDLAVYLEDKVEVHPDVAQEYKDVKNTVINIAKGGTYHISGARENTQIAVNAGDKDDVTLILDGVEISCMTAPAILVAGGRESAKAGESGVVIKLADGSVNKITGSHTARINDDDVKYDAAISSAVSMTLDGTGELQLVSDNEGIESKMHLTVNSGNIMVKSKDDALNASEDGVSVITINGGYLYCHVDSTGEEGDGIDSNGTIVINGGTVISYANANSPDSGLDADGGTTINGGAVLACGNMMDSVNRDSKQNFIQLMFKEKQSADTLYVLTDEKENPVAAFSIPSAFTNIQLSTPELKSGNYKLYTGGTLVGDMKNGFGSELTSYSVGTLMQHGGEMQMNMQPPQLPEGMTPPEGMERGERPEPPEGMERGERPKPPEGMERGERPTPLEGMDKGERPTPPEGMDKGERRGPGGMRGGMSTEVSTVFEISEKNRMFINITVAE